MKQVMRFPRFKRSPRFHHMKERNVNGTLLCICGNPGREFYYCRDGKLRGICSDVCYRLWYLYARRKEAFGLPKEA